MEKTQNWYVMQVRTGTEENICIQCRKDIGEDILENCFLPRYEEKRKIRGEWKILKKLLFPGYVFVISDDIDQLYQKLKKVIGLTKLIGTGKEIIPLTEEEVRLLMKFGGEEQIVAMSEGMIEGSNVIINSGPLKGMEGYIRKIDRHKRKAYLEVPMFNGMQNIQVGWRLCRRNILGRSRIMDKEYYLNDSRFKGIEPFPNKIWLSSPTMHGDEEKWVVDAIRKNWVSTVGENINIVEQQIAEFIGRKYAVGLSSGTAALHLAVKLCGEQLYGQPKVGHGTLEGHKVFCSDMTFDATVNPVAYEGGEAVFIDTEYDTWNMDPAALEKAFEIYPDVKLIVVAHLYGAPGKIGEIRDIADKHGALIVEDAAESLGATYNGIQTGCFGDVSIVSMNGNKLITGSSGGMLLTDNLDWANKVRKWSTQSRENAPWYQHEELGYNYRMSNIIAGVIRGQLPYIDEHKAQKKAIYERYKEKLAGLPVSMNPIELDGTEIEPNYWLSCLLIDKDAMCPQMRGEQAALYKTEPGKSCPTEILGALAAFNAEGRPIWKPMHMQPLYRMSPFVTRNGNGRGKSNAYIIGETAVDVGADIFERGLCLPSDNKMTVEDVDRVVEIIRRCFECLK